MLLNEITHTVKWQPFNKTKTNDGYELYDVEVKTIPLDQLRPAVHDLFNDEDDVKVIRRYATAMSKGVAFPMIEVYPIRSKRYKYGISDGNHRFFAYSMLSHDPIPCVVVLGETKKTSKY